MGEIHKQIRDKVAQSSWRTVPYRNGGTPTQTYDEIVNDSFDAVKISSRSASHCKLQDMYHPWLGNLRRAKSYSALAPTNGMHFRDRYRYLAQDMRPFDAYKPKQGEWRSLKEKAQRPASCRWGAPHQIPEPVDLPLAPTVRRQYAVPADPTRFENFYTYWNGRAKGLDYCEPFLHQRERDSYDIEEDRRYQRLYWAPVFIPSQPTARHARQIILTAY